jgi:hypothetical protein
MLTTALELCKSKMNTKIKLIQESKKEDKCLASDKKAVQLEAQVDD